MKTAKFEAVKTTTLEGKTAVQFAVRNISKIEGLSKELENLGFRLIISNDAAVRIVTKKEDATTITNKMREFFNSDGSSK